MQYFKLPDLGEGLVEAEIVQWHVGIGDDVVLDQLLLSVETAKAIVDIPSPCTATVKALFGQEGDLIHIGETLIEFDGGESDALEQMAEEDSGTVVGKLEQADTSTMMAKTDHFVIGSANSQSITSSSPSFSSNTETQVNQKASPSAGIISNSTPAVRALAKHLDIDLEHVVGSGRNGLITSQDVERAAQIIAELGVAEKLRGVRRSMAINMALSHSEVVPVTLCDDVDIHDWPEGTDVTMRLVRAIAEACAEVPDLNVWFDSKSMSRRLLKQVNLGIAVDSKEGLFVPVLKGIASRSENDLRQGLDRLRRDVQERSIPASEMQDASITLSNFGTLAGRYANPVIVPPAVAIVGAGKIREDVVPYNGEPAVRRVLPLSLTIDHRVVTGGEGARFLSVMMNSLRRVDV